MPNIHLKTAAAGGNDSNDGSTWALAKATLVNAVSALTAGDTLYIDSAFAETETVYQPTFPGTLAAPNFILSGTPNTGAGTGLTALVAGATITATAASSNTFYGSAYVYGLTFIGSSGSTQTLAVASGASGNVAQMWETCTLRIDGGAGSSGISLGYGGTSTNGSVGRFRNCSFKLAHAAQRVSTNGAVFIDGGALLTSAGLPATVFSIGGADRGSRAEIRGFDFSAAASTVNLCVVYNAGFPVLFDRCKLPTGWSGAVLATPTVGSTVLATNCDSGNTNYRMRQDSYEGVIVDETTIVRTGGAADGTTSIAWRMAATNVAYPVVVLRSPWIYAWNDTTTGNVSGSVEVLCDSASAIQNNQAWIELSFLGNASYPLGSLASDAPAGLLTAATAQTTSGASWNGTSGMSNVQKLTLSATFAPRQKGYVGARVCWAATSPTYLYVDPVLTLAAA